MQRKFIPTKEDMHIKIIYIKQALELVLVNNLSMGKNLPSELKHLSTNVFTKNARQHFVLLKQNSSV